MATYLKNQGLSDKGNAYWDCVKNSLYPQFTGTITTLNSCIDLIQDADQKANVDLTKKCNNEVATPVKLFSATIDVSKLIVKQYIIDTTLTTSYK